MALAFTKSLGLANRVASLCRMQPHQAGVRLVATRSSANGGPSEPKTLGFTTDYKPTQYDEREEGPEDYPLEQKQKVMETGMVFSPFAEAGSQMASLDKLLQGAQQGVETTQQSLARLDFSQKAEAAINEQINIEYNMSYVYHAMSSYFNRDNVGLPGFAAYFLHESLEERSHAQLLMDYQSRRGGRVKLAAIGAPLMDYYHPEKGDALHAAELALSLEKLNFQKLRELHALAEEAHDSSLTHYIEDFLLDQQSVDVKEAAVFVARLQRVGKGYGVYQIDLELQEKYGAKAQEP